MADVKWSEIDKSTAIGDADIILAIIAGINAPITFQNFRTVLNGYGVIKPIRIETADYPIVETDYTILLDASSDDVSGVLPEFPNQGQIFNIICVDSTFACIVEGNGHAINGVIGDRNLLATESLTIQFDSTYGWIILTAEDRNPVFIKLGATGLDVYIDNDAAIAGGLTVGEFYRSGSTADKVCVVH